MNIHLEKCPLSEIEKLKGGTKNRRYSLPHAEIRVIRIIHLVDMMSSIRQLRRARTNQIKQRCDELLIMRRHSFHFSNFALVVMEEDFLSCNAVCFFSTQRGHPICACPCSTRNIIDMNRICCMFARRVSTKKEIVMSE